MWIEYIPAEDHDQINQRNKLNQWRAEIAIIRSGHGLTVWDNLGKLTCGDLSMLPGGQGFRYHNFDGNARWWKEFKEKYKINFGPLPGDWASE